MLFYFSGGGTIMVPNGFNTADRSTWHLATTATYTIMMSGGGLPLGSMSICNEASNVPFSHVCPHFGLSGTGYIGIDPGFSTLHFVGYMSAGYSGYASLLGASLSVEDRWIVDPDFVAVATTPIPARYHRSRPVSAHSVC